MKTSMQELWTIAAQRRNPGGRGDDPENFGYFKKTSGGERAGNNIMKSEYQAKLKF